MAGNNAIQGCKAKNGVLCVLVRRSDLPATGAAGVTVTLSGPTGGTAVTDANGIARFTDRKPGNYTYKLALPGGKSKSWQLDSPGGASAVSRGQVTVADAQVHAVGTLIVSVHDDLGNRVEADTTSSVPYLGAGDQGKHSNANLYMTVGAGAAAVSAVPSKPHLYAPLAAPINVNVAEGGTERAAIVLRVLNSVTPSLVPARDEVWFVRPDPVVPPFIAPPLPPGSVAVVPEPPPPATVRSTHVEASVAINLGINESLPAKPYTGTGTLTFDAARVQIYRDAACTNPPLASGLQVTNGELKAGLLLYMKGADDGIANIDLTLTPSANADIVLTRASIAKPVTVKEINVVEPVIKVEHRVVVYDQLLTKHQKRNEPEKFTPTPTFVDLSATTRIVAPAYTKTATLLATPALVEMFTDAECKKKFDAAKPIPFLKLTGPQPLRLYFKAVTTGTFELQLTMAPSGDPHIIVEHPAKVPMGVVQLRMDLHQHDEKAVAALTVDPDVATYEADLEALVLPDTIVMTKKEAIADGRLLHMQDADESFGRAKLLVKKLIAAEWPAGVDNYKLVLTATNASGTVKVFDKDAKANPAGVELPLPVELKVADLLAAEKELWIEGATTGDDWRSVRLDLGFDRAEPASNHHVPIGDKEVKRNGDWARFTVVKINNLRVIYKPKAGKAVAWDAPQNRYYINVEKDPAARAMKIGAELIPALEGVKLHLMLAPHEHNRKVANWGIDMPATWTWGAITENVKHKDRKTRTAFLSYDAVTDKEGKVKKTVVLSRFGGDKFWPAAHLPQDPHLAKFIDGHATLGLRKPVKIANAVEVYRKFWVRKIAVAGVVTPVFGGASGQYTAVKAEMVTLPDLTLTVATVNGYKPPAIYPRYMIEVNGGNNDALVVSDPNKGNFFKTFKADSDKPNTTPILVCDAQWDPGGTTAGYDVSNDSTAFPMALDVGDSVLDPPLQGGKLVTNGSIKLKDWDPINGVWINERTVKIRDGCVDIDPNRAALTEVRLNLPAGIVVSPNGTQVEYEDLVVKFANDYLGESFKKRILAVYDPTDPGDFQNTIAHELGHSFQQVIQGDGGVAGLPPHPEQLMGQGNHCVHNGDECVMFTAKQPVGNRLNNYCTVCQPYLLVQDMSVKV